MNDERMNELESRLAFQDDLIDRLNDVVAAQDRQLLDLQARLDSLQRRVDELAEAAPASAAPPGHEVPPHY
jgi:SlyX protein